MRAISSLLPFSKTVCVRQSLRKKSSYVFYIVIVIMANWECFGGVVETFTVHLLLHDGGGLPIFISLFLQSPMGGHPALLFSSSSRCSKGWVGPRKYCLYSGKSLKKNIPSSTNTYNGAKKRTIHNLFEFMCN